MPLVVDGVHARRATCLRSAISALDRIADARSLGIEPVEAAARAAIAAEDQIERFLRQGKPADPAETLAALGDLADTLEVSDGH